MNSENAITAGIEHGGLTRNSEIRMLICWLLDQVKLPVTMTLLNEALRHDELVNYFALARGVSDLLASGHILEGEHLQQEEAPLELTQLGRDTAREFARDIPLNVREKSLAALRSVLQRERARRENAVKIEKTPDGCRMTMQISDIANDLLDLSIYVPTTDLADRMKELFLDDPGALYRLIVRYLSGGEL